MHWKHHHNWSGFFFFPISVYRVPALFLSYFKSNKQTLRLHSTFTEYLLVITHTKSFKTESQFIKNWASELYLCGSLRRNRFEVGLQCSPNSWHSKKSLQRFFFWANDIYFISSASILYFWSRCGRKELLLDILPIVFHLMFFPKKYPEGLWKL